jgi:hypothetical protein
VCELPHEINLLFQTSTNVLMNRINARMHPVLHVQTQMEGIPVLVSAHTQNKEIAINAKVCMYYTLKFYNQIYKYYS